MSAPAELTVRVATVHDLKAIVAIERLSFGDAWTRGMFAWHLDQASGDIFLVACDPRVLGYAIARVVGTECELFNIAAHPEHRGRGIGAMLLDAVMQRCISDGAREMWLEVRASNGAAIGLYVSRGFVSTGRRKGYYESPREDALLLRAELDGVPSRTRMVRPAGPGLPSDSGVPILSSASQPPRQETI